MTSFKSCELEALKISKRVEVAFLPGQARSKENRLTSGKWKGWLIALVSLGVCIHSSFCCSCCLTSFYVTTLVGDVKRNPGNFKNPVNAT